MGETSGRLSPHSGSAWPRRADKSRAGIVDRHSFRMHAVPLGPQHLPDKELGRYCGRGLRRRRVAPRNSARETRPRRLCGGRGEYDGMAPSRPSPHRPPAGLHMQLLSSGKTAGFVGGRKARRDPGRRTWRASAPSLSLASPRNGAVGGCGSARNRSACGLVNSSLLRASDVVLRQRMQSWDGQAASLTKRQGGRTGPVSDFRRPNRQTSRRHEVRDRTARLCLLYKARSRADVELPYRPRRAGGGMHALGPGSDASDVCLRRRRYLPPSCWPEHLGAFRNIFGDPSHVKGGASAAALTASPVLGRTAASSSGGRVRRPPRGGQGEVLPDRRRVA